MSDNNKKRRNPFSIYWVYGIIVISIIGIQVFMSGAGDVKIKYPSTFFSLADSSYVSEVKIVNRMRADFKLNKEGREFVNKSDEKEYAPIRRALAAGKKSMLSSKNPTCQLDLADAGNFEEQLKEINKALKSQGKKPVKYYSTEEVNYISNIISFLLPIIILVVIWMFVMRRMTGGGGGGGPGGQIFNIGKSKAQIYEKGKSTDVTFKDVAGLTGAKEEIQEIVEFLKHPKKYTDLGAKIPKGALLVGPPGTGKTLLAKAVAGEAKVPFFSLSGSDFVEMFVGVGASRVRDLFKQAKEKSPAIIFIDEIDAIGRARGRNNGFGANDERENTLNQLLTEMDGFGTNSGVIILAATNRADVLDKALMRAGRFDRQIYVDMPDINERAAIFKVHLKPLKLDKEIDVSFLAKQTPGFSGADIANLCNEAALIAARHQKDQVELQDFLDAVDRIVGGLEKKNKIITKEEKRAIAFHEAGHATISWLLEHASPLVKVTIVPRGQSLGAAWYLPEERSITTTEQILDEVCSALGGRAAEELIFGKISTGALSDLEKVTKQAYAIVSIYGLNKRIGNVSYYDSQGRDSFTKPYSDETAKIIDEEVSKLIEEQYQRALSLLTENKDKLIQLAEKLLEKEVIFKENLEDIFGKRQWDPQDVVEEIKEEARENELEEGTAKAETATIDSERKTSEDHSADNKEQEHGDLEKDNERISE
ncbi:MAG: ATP-dependent zinc metalloprotease FtsH [Bacteroidetes bacterium]|nr:MAG: ATP-dependent zinc metalloprotease FtsH [Bacteroidota bacterium]